MKLRSSTTSEQRRHSISSSSKAECLAPKPRRKSLLKFDQSLTMPLEETVADLKAMVATLTTSVNELKTTVNDSAQRSQHLSEQLTALITANSARITSIASDVQTMMVSQADLEKRVSALEVAKSSAQHNQHNTPQVTTSTEASSAAQPQPSNAIQPDPSFAHTENMRREADILLLTDSIDQNVNLVEVGRETGWYVFRQHCASLANVKDCVKSHPTKPKMVVIGNGMRDYENICKLKISPAAKTEKMNELIAEAVIGVANVTPSSKIAIETLSPLLYFGGKRIRQVWDDSKWATDVEYEVVLPSGEKSMKIETNWNDLSENSADDNGPRVFPTSVIAFDGKHLAHGGTAARQASLARRINELLPGGDSSTCRRLEPSFRALRKIRHTREQKAEQSKTSGTFDVDRLARVIASAVRSELQPAPAWKAPPVGNWPSSYKGGYGKDFPAFNSSEDR